MHKQIHNPKQFGRVAVLMGGLSKEREISLMSGNQILQALQNQDIDAYGIDVDKNILSRLMQEKPDRIFIALHGKGGEDGVLQGALHHLHIPHTGSGVAACALAIDKQRAKLIWQALGLPTPAFRVLRPHDSIEKIVDTLGLPLFVKPIFEGSSLGVCKATSAAELLSAVTAAKDYYSALLIEKYVAGPEYTVSILGNEVLPSVLIKTPHTFYDYNAKYFTDTTEYICPSDLSSSEEAALQKLALQAYKALGCSGWGRVDLMRDGQGKFWLIEVNTAPGMTTHSLVPVAARAAGLSFEDLVWIILEQTFSPSDDTAI